MTEKKLVPKSPWQSKSLWGGMLMLVALILGHFGIEMTDEQQTHWAEVIGRIVELLGTTAGPLLLVWGRKTADQPLSMRKILPGGKKYAPILLAGLMIVGFGGCQSTTRVSAMGQVVLARQIYTTTLQTLTTFKTMGAIDAPTYEKIEVSRKAAAVALDAAEKAAAEGGTQFDTAMDALDAALDALIAWRAQMETVP